MSDRDEIHHKVLFPADAYPDVATECWLKMRGVDVDVLDERLIPPSLEGKAIVINLEALRPTLSNWSFLPDQGETDHE